ncbi:MAG: FAD-binding oxidoreductase [Alphaproteobacteria bacterium]|nr:FAD-binding oxidoreductase [Alphaproteobacteria bacterium]
MAPDASANPPDAAALDQIKAVVGAKGWIEDKAELEPWLKESRGYYVGACALMVRPETTEQVAKVVEICSAHGIAVVPQGGNTGLCGGAVPNENGREILLNLGRMKAVRDIDPLNYTITVEAGCILADIQEAASDADRLFPLSLAAEGSCTIGGNLSTNAGGVNVVRYGNTRDLVLGLEVVLPSGEIWNGLRRLRKDNTGYDLKQLFVGGEGTLGVITAAVLKLFPKPKDVHTCFAAVRDLDAVIELLTRAREASGDAVTSFEMIPRRPIDYVLEHIPDVVDPLQDQYELYTLIEFSGARANGGMGANMESMLETAFEDGLVLDAAVAQSESQRAEIWKIRESIPEAQVREGFSIKHDVSVPVSKIPAFVRQAIGAVEALIPGVRPCPFGHVGDGNLHFNFSYPVGADGRAFMDRWAEVNRIVHDIVTEMGGSISAEHGIGLLKREEFHHYTPELDLSLMRRIKAAIDPNGIMNPGKIL